MFHPSIDIADFTTVEGNIDYGKLIRYWRRGVIKWQNTYEIVALYNELLNEDVSIRWWQRMEKENRVPVDLKRRWVIARILDLPALYLSLPLGEAAFSLSDEIKLPIPTAKAVNIHRYNERLQVLWASPYGHLNEVLMRIYALQEALLYGSDKQKKQVAYLLCHYLVLSGNIQRAEGYLTSAIWYLDKAIKLAKEKEYDELLAKALYLRGYCSVEKWSVYREKGHSDFFRALIDFQAAHEVVKTSKRVSSQSLRGAILAEWGSTLSHRAQDVQDRSTALSKVNEAGKVVSASSFRHDPYFLKVNEEWYHIDKAEALIALNHPELAIEEITNIYKGNPRTMRRYLTATLVEAEAYVAKGQVEIGTAYAIDALKIAGDIPSRLHLARVNYLYTFLRQQEKYKRSSDVARLGVELLKVQKPEIFH